MSIPETFHFDNTGEVVRYPSARRYFLASVIILVALLSFGIGRLTGTDRAGVSVNYDPSLLETDKLAGTPIGDSKGLPSVYASSQGTKYYYTHCGSSISEKNKVTFATAALAEAAGYTLAKNCAPK
jgi:hypothetical protein